MATRIRQTAGWLARVTVGLTAMATLATAGGSGGVTMGTLRWSQQRAAAATPPGLGQSQNWAGYAATGGPFTSVTGTWTVPQVSASTPFASDATWVGIGGVTSRDLLQAGTEATILGTGQTTYQAWVETLPQPSRPVTLTVQPGDSLTVSITASNIRQWNVTFTNHTTGQSAQRTVTYRSSESSAEWIEEAPSGRRATLPLDNFGTISFSAAATVVNGQSETIAQAGGQAITMTNRFGQAVVTPSSLGADGASFTVTRNMPAAAPTTPTATGSAADPDGDGDGVVPWRVRPLPMPIVIPPWAWGDR